MTAMPASVCAPFSSVMGEREQQLKQQISCCQEGSSEHAALLTELAGLSLAQGRMDEANSMLQQVYIMRMKDFVASTGAQGAVWCCLMSRQAGVTAEQLLQLSNKPPCCKCAQQVPSAVSPWTPSNIRKQAAAL